MLLSILIVNWNTCEKLDACLASIAAYPPSQKWEAIVVDNNSKDGSEEMTRTKHPWAKLIQTGANTGYAMGNNIACQAAQGSLLLTLNPDTEFFDDSLQKAIDFLQAKPKAAAVGIKLILPDGSVQKSVRGFPTILGLIGAGLKLDRLFPKSALAGYTLPLFNHLQTQPAQQPMGTFILFKKEALASVGDPNAPFDPAFPIFFNEVDLLWRIHQKGWEVWHLAEAECRHHHGASTRQVRPQMAWESHYSLVRYLRKNAVGPERLFLPLTTVLSYGTAFVRARGFHGGFQPEHHHLQLEHPK